MVRLQLHNFLIVKYSCVTLDFVELERSCYTQE